MAWGYYHEVIYKWRCLAFLLLRRCVRCLGLSPLRRSFSHFSVLFFFIFFSWSFLKVRFNSRLWFRMSRVYAHIGELDVVTRFSEKLFTFLYLPSNFLFPLPTHCPISHPHYVTLLPNPPLPSSSLCFHLLLLNLSAASTNLIVALTHLWVWFPTN